MKAKNQTKSVLAALAYLIRKQGLTAAEVEKLIIKTIKDTMFRFLWNGKPDKIKRNVIIQDYNKGGLKMIEIDSYINALKTKWIKRILDENNKGLWKEIYLKEIIQFSTF